MTYELTFFVLLVMAATLTASWVLAMGIERPPSAVVKPVRRWLSRRTVRVGVLTVLGVVIVAAGAFGVVRWGTHRSLETGARLLSEGNAAEAVRVLDAVAAARPADARVHYYLGAAYARLGVSTAALTHLKDAVRIEPREATFHRALGAAYRQTGDAGSARKELETAVGLEPSKTEHRITLAGALVDEGDVENAVKQLRRAVEGRPKAPEIRLLLATTLNLAGDRNGMLRNFTR